MRIRLTHPITGKVRYSETGLSGTTALFAFFPAFLRKDWFWGGVQLLAYFLTLGFSNLFFIPYYNHIHLKTLVWLGYQLSGKPSVATIESVQAAAGVHLPVAGIVVDIDCQDHVSADRVVG